MKTGKKRCITFSAYLKGIKEIHPKIHRNRRKKKTQTFRLVTVKNETFLPSVKFLVMEIQFEILNIFHVAPEVPIFLQLIFQLLSLEGRRKVRKGRDGRWREGEETRRGKEGEKGDEEEREGREKGGKLSEILIWVQRLRLKSKLIILSNF